MMERESDNLDVPTAEFEGVDECCGRCDHPKHWHLFHPGHAMEPEKYPHRPCNVSGCGCDDWAEDQHDASGEPEDPKSFIGESEPEVVEGEIVAATAVVPYAPASGSVIELSDRPRVAATIREITDWQAEVLRPLLDTLQGAMIEEADTQGKYTIRYGRLEIKVDGPDVAKTEWQEDLQPMIDALLAIGLPAERADVIATKRTVWKVNGTEINRIAKNPKYAAVIDQYRERQPRKRSATVRRVGNS